MINVQLALARPLGSRRGVSERTRGRFDVRQSGKSTSPRCVRSDNDRGIFTAMKSVIPTLAVADITKSLRFYNDILGFETSFTMPGDDGELVHASVQRGDVSLMFSPQGKPGLQHAGEGVVLYFTVGDDDDIDAEFAHARANGATIVQEPTDQFWGHRDWTIADPDGYHLTISKEVRKGDFSNLTAEALAGIVAD
jgi:PhnB protein